jgi:hypothetical protein
VDASIAAFLCHRHAKDNLDVWLRHVQVGISRFVSTLDPGEVSRTDFIAPSLSGIPCSAFPEYLPHSIVYSSHLHPHLNQGMDWTGGTRRRFAAGKGNATLRKQKAHFAKARATAHVGARDSDPSKLTANILHPAVSKSHLACRLDTTSGSTHRYDDKRATEQRGNWVSTSKYTLQKVHSGRPSASNSRRIRPEERTIPPQTRPASQQIHRDRAQPHGIASSAPELTDEMKLLLARRRRLLARTDWLGLAAMRPASITFASSHDKNLIGRRRRVRKATGSKRVINGLQSAQPPPYHALGDTARSDGVSQDHIEVRIGPGAMGTQTQHSRPSHHSRQTSIRPPSTDVALLSEESMLLGDDGDAFETLNIGAPPPPGDDADSLYALMTEKDSHIDGVATPMQHFTGQVELMSASSANKGDSQSPLRDMHYDTGLELRRSVDVGPSSHDEFSPPKDELIDLSPHWQQTSAPAVVKRTLDSPALVETHSREQSQDNDDDEKIWRQFLNIPTAVQSNDSLAAVKSSSLHNTASTYARDRSIPQDELADYSRRTIFTPTGVGTQYSTLLVPGQRILRHSPDSSSSEVRPIAARRSKESEIPFYRPETTVSKTQAEARDDELWRSFIIDSTISSEASIPFNLNTTAQSESELERHSTARCPSPVLSGLGTSNWATAAGTQGRDEVRSSYFDVAPGHDYTAVSRMSPSEDDMGASITDTINDRPVRRPIPRILTTRRRRRI